MWFTMRKCIGLAALGCLAGLVVTSSWSDPIVGDRLQRAAWLLLTPLTITMVGLWREAYWSRWLSLAAGVGLLPWAAAVAITPGFSRSALPRMLLLAASATLLLTLTGKHMLQRYEGRFEGLAWHRPGMGLVRWAIICNVASALSLYPFVVAYDHAVAWHLVALASLLACLVAGVWLLAMGRTAGLLAVAFASVCLVPVGAHFVWLEAANTGEAVLFALLFLPGILTGWACLARFVGPMWRFVAPS